MKEVRIGTSGWAYASWKPDFYPPKTPASKFLNYYATQLNCVEVNFTFRQRPQAKTLQSWCDTTPDTFNFVTKAHQRITHIKRLKDVEADVLGFFESLEPLSAAGKLGPVLFQLPPNLKLDVDRLRAFLKHIPTGKRAAIEFRNESWWNESVFDLMREHDVALCIAESDGLEVPEVYTAGFAYFRFRKSDYSESAVNKIANHLSQVATERDIYAFLKHEETPEGALNARRLLNALSTPIRKSGIA
ncbi:MAG TPA: DUF72 domain-containing protein [Candidatus Saccharimonadales bacterium]|nr:DUF72 domain-containing protein [Candidatus Saccharimonadales bacterium]